MWGTKTERESVALVKMIVIKHCEDGATIAVDKYFKVGDDFIVTLDKVSNYCKANGIVPLVLTTAWHDERLATPIEV